MIKTTTYIGYMCVYVLRSLRNGSRTTTNSSSDQSEHLCGEHYLVRNGADHHVAYGARQSVALDGSSLGMFHQFDCARLPDYGIFVGLPKISDRGDAIVCPETVKRLNDTFN